MMHHPSQFGSNLKTTPEPEHTPYPPQHPVNQNQESINFDNFDQSNTFSPKGNVAALRNVIHGQLDMKTPTGNSSRFQKPAPPPVDTTPSWAKNVKVYEPNGYVDPHLNKHNMGRVLDGPVNPNKFFQGVPPPSYSQVKGIPHTETKPPPPPSKPIQTQAQALQAQVLQNQNPTSNFQSKPPSDPFRPSQKTSYRIPYDQALDPRHHFGEFEMDDSASIISSCISTFGESSEIAGFSAAAEQRHLYEQYRKKLMEEKNELKEGSETPCVSLSEKVPSENPPEPIVTRSIFDTELTPFGHASKVQNPQSQEAPKPNINPFSTPSSTNPFDMSLVEKELKRSIDLESSQLLVKPKSPAPYSTSSSDHYGTIRRKHKPVAIDLSETTKSSPKDKSPSSHFFGNNFEEKTLNRSPLTPSYKDHMLKNDSLNESLNQAFEIASSIESTKNNYEPPHTPKSVTNDRSISDTYPVSSQQQQWPLAHPQPPLTSIASTTNTTTSQKEQENAPMTSSTMSNSMSTSVPNMDESIVFNQQSPDSSPERHEDMSQWYRKMFKQMHKKGDDTDRFVDNNNRSVESTGNLGRSQENFQHQSVQKTAPPADSFFDNFEHGPTEQQNYGQERVKQLNEDELLRLRAEKLAEELKKEKERKHGFIPSAAPSLQNNMDRLNSLLYDFSNDTQEPTYKDYPSQTVMTATAVYKFEPRSSRELPLNRGDIVRIIREVDAYWMEGERNGRCGIFPMSYVQINSGNQSDTQKMRAIYPFTARSDTELSLKRGEIITRRRQIDSNWLEGSNQIGIVGIFPASYVEPLSSGTHEIVPDVMPSMSTTVFPNRPKTPKLDDQVYNQFYNKPSEQPIATVVPNNKVRFDLPSSSDSNLQISLNPIQTHPIQNQVPVQSQQPSYGMKKIEYERETKVDEEPILDQYRKLNDEPKQTNTMMNAKKDNNILMNAASLIPKGSEMYRAIYPYQPQKDDELQLYTNDIIFVVEKCDDGWYIGTSLRTGDFGIFPGNYVKRH